MLLALSMALAPSTASALFILFILSPEDKAFLHCCQLQP
jgi:hypothetical protein